MKDYTKNMRTIYVKDKAMLEAVKMAAKASGQSFSEYVMESAYLRALSDAVDK